MVSRKIFHLPGHEKFRHRSEEILRIEALSDAVFAFSVSLLVASLEVPQTFEELKKILFGAIPFFTTVGVIFLLWYQQYIFFRHYALNDLPTILFNLIYLAVILFYVYPLKFLFSLLIASWTGIDLFPEASAKGLPVLLPDDFPSLVIIFSTGYFLVWLLLYFMHRRALQLARELELNNYEAEYTHKEIRGALWNCLVGVVSIFFAATGFALLSGITYLLIPLLLIINERIFTNAIVLRKK
ncbi:MAG TPA: TMEM175 family protein [Parafilimonas sp.]|nr:TMEM175 family protein [Parafilimonas sp.]